MKVLIANLSAAVLVSVLASAVTAPTATAKSDTHLNVPTENLVTLLRITPSSPMIRVLPDGTREGAPGEDFIIPEGMVLVVTDVQWDVFLVDPGQLIGFQIQVDNVDDNVLLFRQHGVADSNGVASLSKSFTSGITIGPSAERPTVTLEVFATLGLGGTRAPNTTVILRGYLTDSK